MDRPYLLPSAFQALITLRDYPDLNTVKKITEGPYKNPAHRERDIQVGLDALRNLFYATGEDGIWVLSGTGIKRARAEKSTDPFKQ